MRTRLTLLATSLASGMSCVAGVAASAQDTFAPAAAIIELRENLAALRTEAYVSAPTGNVDGLRLMLDGMSQGDVPLAYDSIGRDDASGAIVISDVMFGPLDDGDMTVSLVVGEIALWGLDTDSIMMIAMTGGTMEESQLVERVAIRDVAFTVSQSGTDISLVAEDLVLDGLTLAGTGAPVPSAPRIDGFVLGGLSMDAVINDPVDGTPMDVDMSVGQIGFMGYDLADLAAFTLDDVSLNMLMRVPDEAGELASVPLSLDLAALSVSQLSLTDLISGSMVGGLPTMDVVDLYSGGEWSIQGMSFDWKDVELFGLDALRINAVDTHWLVPTDFSITTQGLSANLTGLVDFAATTDPEGFMEEFDGDAETLAMFVKAMPVLDDNGLGTLTYNSGISFTWAPDSGALGLTVSEELVDGYGYDIAVNALVPDYSSMVDTSPAGVFNPDALSVLFATQSRFVDARVVVSEDGLIDKGLGVAQDLSASFPDVPPQLSNFFNTFPDPETQRPMLGNMLRASVGFVAGEMPAAVPYINAVADLVSSGGEVVVTADPASPLGMFDMMGLAAYSDPADAVPAALDVFNVQVTHTAP